MRPATRGTQIALGLTCGLMFGGCRSGPPTPKPPVNAVLAPTVSIYGQARYLNQERPTGDTRLRARVRSSDEYAQRKRNRNWVVHWYAVRLDVLAVERGTWSEPTLSFVVSDMWPTLESGILVYTLPWPYRPGVEWVFELDTSRKPAVIVDQLEPESGETATQQRP